MKAIMMLLVLSAALAASAQKLTVVAVSHQVGKTNFPISPATTSTDCSALPQDGPVHCNSTTQAATGVPFFTVIETVEAEGVRYRLRGGGVRPDYFVDGDTYNAEIKGKYMYIEVRKGDWQSKKTRKLKFTILDAQPE